MCSSFACAHPTSRELPWGQSSLAPGPICPPAQSVAAVGTASQSWPHRSATPGRNNDFVSPTKLVAPQPCLSQQHWTFPRRATQVGFKHNIASLIDNVKACDFKASWHKSFHRAHPDLSQGPADLQSAALTTELCTHVLSVCSCTTH